MSTMKKGLDMILYAGGETPDAVGGQKGCNLSINADVIDISTKVTGKWRKKTTGALEWSGSCDGVIMTGDKALTAIQKAMTDRTEINIEMAESTVTDETPAQKSDGLKYSGKCIITSFEIDGQLEDMLTYSISFEGSGELKITEGTSTLAE